MNLDLSCLAGSVGEVLCQHDFMLTTAESCTGGWVAQTLTSVVGSSHWFERGFVTYTNIAKQEMLGVNPQTLEEFGAVSEQTVKEMALGALKHSHAQIALAISGVAGPGGGSPEKPVGTVCFAWAAEGYPTVYTRQHFAGNRENVRSQSVAIALQGVLDLLSNE